MKQNGYCFMLKKNIIFISGFIIAAALCHNAGASPSHPPTSQSVQEQACETAVTPYQQAYTSPQVIASVKNLIFPKERNCKYIKEIHIESEDNKLTQKLLGKLTHQAKSRCLGVEGIRLLTRSLQNELIVKGYITSLIDVPTQSLDSGILKLTLTYGKIGHIASLQSFPEAYAR